MKTILVPTDFSKIALNAIDYAAEIAKIAKAKLILFHVYDEIVHPFITPLVDLEKTTMKELKKIETRLQEKHGLELLIESKLTSGFIINEIKRISDENQVDLIVIGMEGAGYLKEKLIGSTATSIIQESKCPVMAIDKYVLEPLKDIAQLFKSSIYVHKYKKNGISYQCTYVNHSRIIF